MTLRAPVRLLLALLVLGCGDNRPGGSDAGAPGDGGEGGADSGRALDAGDGSASGDDGGARDGGDGADGGPPDAGPPDAGPPSALVCPVGDADGCCPVALRFGGSDPDCPPLDCANVTQTTPIVLDDETMPSSRTPGTPALAVTDTDLMIVNTTLRDDDDDDVWVQRRDLTTGALLTGPTRHADVTPSGVGFAWGGAALAHAADGSSLYLAHANPSHSAILLDGSDTPANADRVGGSCNGFHQHFAAYDVGDRYLVAQVSENCASPVDVRLVVTALGRDGETITSHTEPSTDRLGLGTALDLAGRRVLLLYADRIGGNAAMIGRLLDVDTFAAEDPVTLVAPRSSGSFDQVRAAYDGTRFGILYSIYRCCGGGFTTYFATWEPGSPISGTVTLIPAGRRRFAHARMLWTGDSWAILMTTIESESTSLAPSARDNPEVWVYRLRPDGSVLESLQMDADQNGALWPDLTMADGRLIASWVRDDTSGRDWHVLSFLDCE